MLLTQNVSDNFTNETAFLFQTIKNKYYSYFFAKVLSFYVCSTLLKMIKDNWFFRILLPWKGSNNIELHSYWLLFICRCYINILIYKHIIKFMTQWICNWINIVWGNYLLLFCDDSFTYIFSYIFYYYKLSEIWKSNWRYKIYL